MRWDQHRDTERAGDGRGTEVCTERGERWGAQVYHMQDTKHSGIYPRRTMCVYIYVHRHVYVWLTGKLTHWKRPWCWERVKVGGEGDDRGSDGWMASPTQCTWVRAGSGSWWWAGKPGVLQSMGSQRVRQDWQTQVNWTDIQIFSISYIYIYTHTYPSI